MRLACFALACASLIACADDESSAPQNLVFTGYEGYESSSTRVELSIDAAQDRITYRTGGLAFTATLTSNAHAQIDAGERQVEDTWDPPEPCPTCRLFPETFFFDSDEGAVAVYFGHVGPGTNVDLIASTVDALIIQLGDCRGGNLIQQCFAQP